MSRKLKNPFCMFCPQLGYFSNRAKLLEHEEKIHYARLYDSLFMEVEQTGHKNQQNEDKEQEVELEEADQVDLKQVGVELEEADQVDLKQMKTEDPLAVAGEVKPVSNSSPEPNNESAGQLGVTDEILYRQSKIEKPGMQCETCKKWFANQVKLTNHIKTVHLVEQLTCRECGSVFNHRTNLLKHEKRMHSKSDKRFECSDCGKSYTIFYDLRRHISSKHNGGTYECQACKKSYVSCEGLQRHMKAKHSGT